MSKNNELSNYFGETHMSVDECVQYVSEQLDTSEKINIKLKNAQEQAELASINSQKSNATAKENLKSAEEMVENVDTGVNAGFGHKKEAIENLQKKLKSVSENSVQQAQAIKMMGTAIESSISAQESINEANALVFENQEKISQIMQSLFVLGTQSIAMNRTVVRQLEMKLEGASQEELESFQMQEIQNVVNQLKQNQDLLYKQEQLKETVHIHDDKLGDIEYKIDSFEYENQEQNEIIAAQALKDEEHDRRLAEAETKDATQDELIAAQALKDEEHDRRLAEAETKDATQDELIAAQALKDEEHDRHLTEIRIKDQEQDSLIAEGISKDIEHEKRFADIDIRDNEQSKRIEICEKEIEELKNQIELLTHCKTKALSVAGTIIAAIAAIIAIIQFFI